MTFDTKCTRHMHGLSSVQGPKLQIIGNGAYLCRVITCVSNKLEIFWTFPQSTTDAIQKKNNN